MVAGVTAEGNVFMNAYLTIPYSMSGSWSGSFGSLAVSTHCLDICSPHTYKLDGVMPWALHGPKAVQ